MTNPQSRYVILAALQFDETGDCALREATRLALRDPRAELHVIHAVGPSLADELTGDITSPAAQTSQITETLKAFIDRACADNNLHVTAHIRAGSATHVILQVAADLDADVLVVGTHQRTGLGRLVLGSIAEEVLRDAHCPVLVATPKSYTNQVDAKHVEPPCAECLAEREAKQDPEAWCERHSRSRMRPHLYSPSDRPRSSVLS